MSDRQVRVTFEPHGRAVFVLKGTKVLEAAGRCGLTIDTPCGGAGTCGKCRVRIMRGAAEPTAAERLHMTGEQLAAGWRLACQSAVEEETVVDVPETSLFASQHQILAHSQTGKAGQVLPAVRKAYVELPAPTLADGVPDLLRLQEALGPVRVGLDLLRRLGGLLRACNFRGTAVMTDHHLIDFEPGDTTRRCHGVAFDIGTTTVVGSLIDLCTGDEVAVDSRLNSQVRFGDDVLSRIKHAGTPAGLAELRGSVLATVEEIIESLCRTAHVARGGIYEITIAGNTTMQHLLAGIDPAQLGVVPFVPALGRSVILPAAELGIAIHPQAAAVLFPVIGGFVGGDTVAGMVATRLVEQLRPVLLVDIGTNGEIVLVSGGKVWAASTAAGPAFEGARISCGMRATAGAIEKIVFTDDVQFSTIGGGEPIGLCGSALVDVAAELLRCGVVTSVGRMLPPKDLPAALPAGLRRRVVLAGNGQPAFLLTGGVEASEAGTAGGLAVTQKDIRELQLATGAIRAGITVLVKQAALTVADLDRVYIAGGFGSFIRRNNAQRIGLLPPGVDHQKIVYVGNTSLAGAKWALVSKAERRKADEVARLARHVELSQDCDFQMEFAEAMIFPEG